MEEEEKTFGKEFWIKLIRILVSATLALLAYFLFSEEKYGLAVNLTLNLIAWAILAYDVLIEMFEDIIKEHEFFSEETLMILATVGAFALRAFGVNEFVEAVLVLLLFQVGEMLEDIVTDKSHDAIKSAIALRATSAHKKVGDSFEEIDPKEVKLGDVLLVKVGEVLPADGKIIEGSGALDCSSLTGESLPVLVSIGEEVYAGTILKEGSLLIEVSKEYENNTVSKIISLIEEGGESKSKVTRFVDRFAKVYTPIVMALAVLVAILPPMFLGFSDGTIWANWVYRALNFLIISCPCAIVISVPLAYFAGGGLASKHGIVIKGASIFDALVDLGYLATDKTGTLTKGVFAVSTIHPVDISKEELLEYATAVESRSNHPLASALLHGVDAGAYASKVSDYSEVAGKGVKGVYQGHAILCGKGCHLLDIVQGGLLICLEQLIKQAVDRIGRMRHGVGKAQIGKSLVTQQIGFLLTQRGNLAYVFGIVEFSANAARVVCLVKQFAKVATARIGHERTIVGSKKSDLIILLLECFGHEAGKSCKVGLGIELVLPCACSLLHVLSEDEGKAVEFGAHLAPTLAFLALEGGATANITFVGVFQKTILLGGERGGLGVGIVVPYLLDALEQFFVIGCSSSPRASISSVPSHSCRL